MEFQSELTSNALTKGQGAHGKLGEFLVSFYIYTRGIPVATAISSRQGRGGS